MTERNTPQSSVNRLSALVDKYYSYGIILIILAIGVLGYVVLIGPKYATIRSVGLLEFNSRQDELLAKQDELRQLQKLQTEFAAVQKSELEKLQQVLPEAPRAGDLYAQFEHLAEKSQVELTSISINKGSAFPVIDLGEKTVIDRYPVMKQVGVLDITVKVAALDSYDKLKGFLDMIETNMRLVDLTSLQYQSTQDKDTYSMNLKAYYFSGEEVSKK